MSGVIQVRLRNSTHTRRGATRCAQATMYSLFVREIGNQGGNCSKIAPSFPAPRSGSSAARNRSQAASATAGSTSLRYTRLFPDSPAAASRRSVGSDVTGVGCVVNRL